MDSMVMDVASPVAVRLRRPGWRDPRLLAGLVMVAAAVGLGAWTVSTAQASTPVYLASGTLTPGRAITAADLAVGQVRLEPGEASHYLLVAAGLPQGLVVLRTVGPGELVPRSALGAAASLRVRPVPVAVADPPSAALVAGARVDLWGAPGPRLLAESLEVAEVTRPTGAFAVGGQTTVQVLVPQELLSQVLGALAEKGAVQVVLAPGAVG